MAFQRARLASMALAKGHINRSKGYRALWKTPSENTGKQALMMQWHYLEGSVA